MSGGRPWTPDDEAMLRIMIGRGDPYKLIKKLLGRSGPAISRRARDLGIKADHDAVKKNIAAGLRAFYASGKKRRAPPDSAREKYAANARARNLAGELGVRKHSDQTVKKCRDAILKLADNRLNFAEIWRDCISRCLSADLLC